jgi:hypothetical protein
VYTSFLASGVSVRFEQYVVYAFAIRFPNVQLMIRIQVTLEVVDPLLNRLAIHFGGAQVVEFAGDGAAG